MSPLGSMWSGSRASVFGADTHFRRSLAVLLAFALAVSVVFFAAPSSVSAAGETVTFAAFGDYGSSGDPYEQAVADIVDAKAVDLIITTGDNSYGSTAPVAPAVSTIDYNIGKSYSNYIGNYIGGYGSTATTNRFFPAPGNHDFSDGGGISAYTDYFTLPGNELYYDFVEGPVHFFAIDSQSAAGATSLAAQRAWLEAQLAASTAQWKVVYFHHPAFSSSTTHGSTGYMQWPFEEWGADAVLAGHDHLYERILRDENSDGTNLVYITTGAGGKSLYSCGSLVTGSQECYDEDYGTVIATATDTELTFEFFSIADGGAAPIDTYTLGPIAPPTPEWVAYNDLNVPLGSSTLPDVTSYTYATGGALKDFGSGAVLPVTVTGSTSVDRSSRQRGPAASGTDAHTAFDGIVDLNGSNELDYPIMRHGDVRWSGSGPDVCGDVVGEPRRR